MAYIPSECSLEEYERVIYSGDAKNRLYVKHGDTVIGTNGDNNASPFASKLTIKRRILKNGSKTITLNNFISQEVDLVLHDYKIENLNEEIEIKIGTFIDSINDYVYVPIGKFLIQDNPTTDKNKTTYKLRDFSIKFDVYYNGKPLIDANGGKVTKLQILKDICEQVGVVCRINSFPNCEDEIGIYDNSITARTYITYLAEQAGKMALINRYGELVFVDLNADINSIDFDTNGTVENALEREVLSLVIRGNSKQDTRSGRNLYNYEDVAWVMNECSTDKDGWITITIDNTSGTDVRYANYYTNSLNIKPSTNYNIILEVKEKTGGGGLAITSVYNGANAPEGQFPNWSLNIPEISNSSVYQQILTSRDISDDAIYGLRTFLAMGAGYSGSITFRISVLEDTTITPETFEYEPYGVSPSPDYPSEIETVKGIENEININNLTDQTISGITYTIDKENGSIIANGTATANSFFTINDNFTYQQNETYTLSGCPNFGDYTNKYSLYTDIGTSQKEKDTGDAVTFVPSENVGGIYIVIRNGQTVNNLTFVPMLAKSNYQHPYVPYGSKYLYNKITGENIFEETINEKNLTNQYSNLVFGNFNTVAGQTYFISFDTNNNGGSVYINEYIFEYQGIVSCDGTRKTFITKALYTKNYRWDVVIKSRYTVETPYNISNVMIETNVTSSSPYKPYKGNTILYDLKKNNLFDKNNANIIQSYVADWTTIIQDASHTRSIYVPIVGGETYSVLKSTGNFFRVTTTVDIPVAGGSRTNSYVQDDTASHIIINTSSESKYLIVSYYDGDGDLTEEELLNSIRIYKGIQYDDYYELASIGDTKDELDEATGTLTKRIGKVVLNGSENWEMIGTNVAGKNRFQTNDYANKVVSNFDGNQYLNALSNKFIPTTPNETYLCKTGIASVNQYFVFFNENVCDSLENWINWLSNNPVTVYYELAEPEIIQLDATKIKTFEGTNHITLESGLETNVSLEYVGKKYIHNISPDIVEKFTAGDTYKVSKVLFEVGVNKFEDGTDDNDTLYLNSDNPYINDQKQIDNIFPNLKGFEINSFKTGKVLGNPAVDPSDLIKVEYDGIIYKTLAQYTLNFGGTMTSTYETTVEHEAKQSNVTNGGSASLKKYVQAQINNIDAKFSVEVGEISSGIDDLETNINNTADRVSNTESKINETNTNLADVIGRTTKLEQDSQGWNFEFTTLQNSLDSLDDKVNATDAVTKEIKDYIKFENGNIILEGSDSKCSVVISKEKISFYTNGNESAFISNNELYIKDNTVLNKQTIGKWETKPDSEGNLNTRWIG